MDETVTADLELLISSILDPSGYEYDGEDEYYSCHYCYNHSPRRYKDSRENLWQYIEHESDCPYHAAKRLQAFLSGEKYDKTAGENY